MPLADELHSQRQAHVTTANNQDAHEGSLVVKAPKSNLQAPNQKLHFMLAETGQ
jgi:hypothetical protein